jgi:hypothetical protein
MILDNPKCTTDDLLNITNAVTKVKDDEVIEKVRRDECEKQCRRRLVWGGDNN